MKRAIVSVATNDYYGRGQNRLLQHACKVAPDAEPWFWRPGDHWPEKCPPHEIVPFAFKAFALMDAAGAGYEQLLWLDACMVPLKRIDPIWAHAECYGAWLHENGYSNYEWTADEAYESLFPSVSIAIARGINRLIPHVVGGAFAIDLTHLGGRHFLAEYFRLASKTSAFCGPWTNANHVDQPGELRPYNRHYAPCGPADVRGHRHDQTALSVLAKRVLVPLTKGREFFAYGKLSDRRPLDPILLADGSYA